MALPLWGQLEKSTTDSETIEEAIARLIEEHNDSPDSHLGTGQSLNAHKSDTTIDHPADSVVNDKIPINTLTLLQFAADKSFLNSNFSEGDAWNPTLSATGRFESSVGTAFLDAGDNIGDVSALEGGAGAVDMINWSGDWVWQVSASFDSDSTGLFTFGVCNSHQWSGNSDGVFFRVDNGDLIVGYSHSDGNETTASAGTVTRHPQTIHEFRMIYLNSNDTLYFYVDGVEVATMVNPNTSSNTTAPASFDAEAQDTSSPIIYLFDMQFSTLRI